MTELPLIVGLGNELRGDDGAGLWVADALAARGVDAIRCEEEPIALLELWNGAESALVVDAVPGPRPGRIWRIDSDREELPLNFAERASTHMFGLAEVIEFARPLGMLPARLTVIGIEGTRFGLGQSPSPAVRAAAGDLAATLPGEARDGSAPAPSEPTGVGL
jgi:hydrogenase maturation protease